MFFFWHQAPFVRAFIPLAAGIAIGYHLDPDQTSLSYLLSPAVFLFLLLILAFRLWRKYSSRYFYGVLAQMLLLMLGACLVLSQMNHRQFNKQFPTKADSYIGIVSDYPQPKARSTMLQLDIVQKQNYDGTTEECRIPIIAYTDNDLKCDTMRPGDFVYFESSPQEVAPPLNPYQFNYKRYLINRGITATVYINDSITFFRPESAVFSISNSLKHWRERSIGLFGANGMDLRELGVVAALVLGKKEMVMHELRTSYTDAGVVHILAVSGLHVGIIYLFAGFLLSKVFTQKEGRYYKLIVMLLILWLYAGITGFSPSVLRAATMFSFIAFGKESGKHANIYNMLGASALVLLIINPYLLMEVGFQLSYLAVVGIVFIHPLIYPLWLAPNVFLDKVWSLLVVSLAAQIATLPLSLYYFHQFPNLFLITNLIVIPIATVLLYASVVFILLHWIPFISDALLYVVNGTAWVLNEFIEKIGLIPYAVSKGYYLSVLGMVLLYILYCYLGALLTSSRKVYLRPVLFITLLLVCLSSYRLITNKTSQSLAILGAPRGFVMIAVNGSESLAITIPNQEPDGLLFNIEGYLLKNGIETCSWLHADTCSRMQALMYCESWLVMENKKVCTSLASISGLNSVPDVLIIDSTDLSALRKLDWKDGNLPMLIAHPELRKWQKDQINNELVFLGLSLYDVSEKGAVLLH